MPADGEMVIGSDIPCAQCGYNLRTLGREGRCPECGEEVAWSIERFNIEQNRWPPLTTETAAGLWRRIEGCALCILAILMNQAFFLTVSSSLHWIDRKWQLRVCSATWVLLCWGMLKIARPADGSQRRWGITSACVIAALVLPAVAVFAGDYQRSFEDIYGSLWSVFSSVLLCVAFFSVPFSLVSLAIWLRRAGRPVLSFVSLCCIVCHAVAVMAIRSELRGGFRSSLELLHLNPAPLLALPFEAIVMSRLFAGRWFEDLWIVLPGNVAQLIVVGLLIVLSIECAKARRSIRLSLRDRNASER